MNLTRTQAQRALPGWRLLLGRMHLVVDCGDFSSAVAFVAEVAEIAEGLDHHPEIDIRGQRVHLAVNSHDVAAITRRDVRFGRAVSELVERWGLETSFEHAVEVEVGLDVLDVEAVRSFWRAVTGYVDDGDGLVDPLRVGPRIWFQQLDAPRPQRNRMHLDWNVPHDLVERRLEQALDAGGELVSDAHAPMWWVLADAEGNEVCLSTWQGRDPE